LCSCRSPSSATSTGTPGSASSPILVASAPPAEEPAASTPVASASAAPVEYDEFAKYSAGALVAECIQRTWHGYTCNNAYAAAARRFPADVDVIRALMRLAVRVDAGHPLGGEAEVVSFCQPEKGEGGAYACLYLADGNQDPAGKVAHKFACKGAPPEGQVPIAGGTAACDGDSPVHITALPKEEANAVERCLACGFDPAVSSRGELLVKASAKACVAMRKRLSASEAAFVQKEIEPHCPSGS